MEGNQTDTIKVEVETGETDRNTRCVIKDAEGNMLTSDAATLTKLPSKFICNPRGMGQNVKGRP